MLGALKKQRMGSRTVPGCWRHWWAIPAIAEAPGDEVSVLLQQPKHRASNSRVS